MIRTCGGMSAIVLMFTTLVLFTSKSLYNYPVGIMAIAGLVIFVSSPKICWENEISRIFVLLFFCLWIPLLVSLPDAVNFERSAKTVFGYLRFLFAGLFVIHFLHKKESLEKLYLAIFVFMTFWCFDALFQYFFSANLFGFTKTRGYITGIFYPEITIGHITAVMSPLYFETLRKISRGNIWPSILLVPLVAVVVLSGRRAAWIMLAVSMAGYLLYYLRLYGYRAKTAKKVLSLSVLMVAVVAILISTNPLLQRRLSVSADLFSGNYEAANAGVGKRLDIWKTSIEIYRNNLLNGIGPRGFRYVYTAYSTPDNYFHRSGQNHPHQLLLEVMTETGSIGIAGLLVFCVLLYSFLSRRKIMESYFPCILAVFVSIFPLNTHMAFYGSYWSSVFWWLMILAFTSVSVQLGKQTARCVQSRGTTNQAPT